MVSTGIWEAWTKLIRFSSQKQLPFISHWSCSGAGQTTFGVCSMCVGNSCTIFIWFILLDAQIYLKWYWDLGIYLLFYFIFILKRFLHFQTQTFFFFGDKWGIDDLEDNYFHLLTHFTCLCCSYARIAPDSHWFEARKHSSCVLWVCQSARL